MALINCPECGREVSDKAASCPHCAYPIAQKKQNSRVKIKINMSAIAGKMKIYDYQTSSLLWEGRNGEVAIIENINEPTSIYFCWGLAHSARNDNTFTIDPTNSTNYEFKDVQSFFTVKYVLNEVGIIDSGF